VAKAMTIPSYALFEADENAKEEKIDAKDLFNT